MREKLRLGRVWVKTERKGKKSQQIHLRFTEKMKYDGVFPWVITDESGYKMAHCPKWLICPAAKKYKSCPSHQRRGGRGPFWW